MRSLLIIVCAALLSLTPAAKADTLTDFNVTGTFQSGGSITGTLTFDTTTSQFVDNNLTVIADGQYNNGFAYKHVYNYPISAHVYELYIVYIPGASVADFLILDLPVATLAGYSGSALCSTSAPCSALGYNSVFEFTSGFPHKANFDPLASGSITPQGGTAATPEPSSLLLLGTGLASLCAVEFLRSCRTS